MEALDLALGAATVDAGELPPGELIERLPARGAHPGRLERAPLLERPAGDCEELEQVTCGLLQPTCTPANHLLQRGRGGQARGLALPCSGGRVAGELDGEDRQPTALRGDLPGDPWRVRVPAVQPLCSEECGILFVQRLQLDPLRPPVTGRHGR